MGIVSNIGVADARDPLFEQRLICEPRQRIVESQSMRLPLGFLAFGDIVKGPYAASTILYGPAKLIVALYSISRRLHRLS